MTINNDNRECITSTDEEIEAVRLERIEEIKTLEEADKLEAWVDYLSDERDEDVSEFELHSKEEQDAVKLEFEQHYKKTHYSDLSPVDSHSHYHTVGQLEMVMAMLENLLQDRVIILNSEYYRETSKAFDHMFNLQQLTVLDWFDMPDIKKDV